MVRVVLVAVLAVSPLLAAAFGRHQIEVTDALALTYNGAAFVVPARRAAGRRARHRVVPAHGRPPRRAAVGRPRGGLPQRAGRAARQPARGRASSSRSRAARARASRPRPGRWPRWLESLGHDVVVTFEPGATEVGRRLRVGAARPPGAGGRGRGCRRTARAGCAHRGAAVRRRPRRARGHRRRARPGARARSWSATATSTPRSPTRAPAASCPAPRSAGCLAVGDRRPAAAA